MKVRHPTASWAAGGASHCALATRANVACAQHEEASPRHSAPLRRRTLLLTLLAAGQSPWALGSPVPPVESAVGQLQREWETIRYQKAASDREKWFEGLATKAHMVSETYEGRAEPLIWEGIVLGSLAEQKGGLSALPLLKQARSRFEQALQINDQALEGSAYTGLGVLYYKAPGWPLSFGDKSQARALLTKALSLQPRGLDPNYFYAEYLVESRQQAQALPYLQKALSAPDDPGRPLTNAARRQEARALLDRIRQAR